MQVERTPGLDPFGVSEGSNGLQKPPGTKSGGPKVVQGAPAAPQPSIEPYVRRANETPAVRRGAVEEARRLLAEGALDTPEAARRAAEAILSLGI